MMMMMMMMTNINAHSRELDRSANTDPFATVTK